MKDLIQKYNLLIKNSLSEEDSFVIESIHLNRNVTGVIDEDLFYIQMSFNVKWNGKNGSLHTLNKGCFDDEETELKEMWSLSPYFEVLSDSDYSSFSSSEEDNFEKIEAYFDIKDEAIVENIMTVLDDSSLIDELENLFNRNFIEKNIALKTNFGLEGIHVNTTDNELLKKDFKDYVELEIILGDSVEFISIYNKEYDMNLYNL